MFQYTAMAENRSNSILYIVEVALAEGQEQAARDLAEVMVAATSNEAGTLNYHWAINGNTLQTLEHFESNDATLIHLNNFSENFAEAFMALGTVTACTVYGNPNEPVRAILDGFGSKYMESVATYTR